MKKKILILTNSSSGLYSFRRELLTELVKEHSVVVSSPDSGRFDDLKDIGCEMESVEINRRGINPATDLKLFGAYRRLLRKEKPDVVLTYTIKPNVYGGLACRLAGIPYISTITGLGTAFEKPVLKTVATVLYRLGLKKAEVVMFQNSTNLKLFEGLRIGKQYRSVPGSGVNLDRHCAEAYPETEEEIRLLFIGRLMREKGVYELVEAVRTVRAGGKNMWVDVVGGADENCEDLLAEAEAEGWLYRHGYQKDVHPFIRNCHAIILPSYHEGMANVLLEAAATARPILASDIPGCRETFDEGVTGFGFKVKDAADTAAVIEKFAALSNGERAAMGVAGRKKVEREFDRQLVVAAYVEEIEKAMRER